MSAHFDKVKDYLLDLNLKIVKEDTKEEVVVVEDETEGIRNLVLDCELPILVLQQLIMPVPKNPGDFFKWLLQINNNTVHGAFTMDSDGKNIYFRHTLQLENLDRNELEGAIRSLSLALAEHADELLKYARQ